MADFKLTDVRGIGPKTADGLTARGIDSIAALAAAPVELLSTLPGFFASRSAAVKTAASELLETASAHPVRPPVPAKVEPKKRASKSGTKRGVAADEKKKKKKKMKKAEKAKQAKKKAGTEKSEKKKAKKTKAKTSAGGKKAKKKKKK